MVSLVRIPTDALETDAVALSAWHVTRGDHVSQRTTVATVRTGQTSLEVEAQRAGVFYRAFFGVGESVPLEMPIGGLVHPDERRDSALGDEEPHVDAVTDSCLSDVATDCVRSTRAVSQDGMQGRVSIGALGVSFGSHDADSWPTPVELFLGSFAACLSLSLRYQLEMRDIDGRAITVETAAVPAHGEVDRLTVSICIEGRPIEASTLDRIVRFGRQSCHVHHLLREDLPIDWSWRQATA